MKRILKIAGILLLILLMIGGGLSLSLRLPFVQNYIAHLAVDYLSKKLGTKVKIDKFEWSLLRNVDLRGFYLADRNGDTILYAGTLNADVSYWSLLRRRINLQAVSFEDARVYLVSDTSGKLNIWHVFHREQSQNYLKVNPAIDTTAAPISLLVDIQKLSMKNTSFRYQDEKKQLLVSIELPACRIDVNKVALDKKLIDIRSVLLDGVKAAVKLESKTKNEPPPPSLEAFRFLPPDWIIRWQEFTVLNSSFSYDDINKPEKKEVVDFAHLRLNDINLLARNGSLVRDSLLADIPSLEAKEKSGFKVRKLSGQAKVSIKEISLKNLSLETGHSSMNAFLGFSYHDFTDFDHFGDKIYIKADLDKASLSLKDIHYFFGGAGPLVHNTISLTGKLRGNLKALKGTGIVLRTGNKTVLKCDFYAAGLPDIAETSLNFRIEKLQSSAADIRYIYPANLYPPSFNTLGNISFDGDFDGFISDFVTRGHLVTEIGSATSDLNFKYNKQTGKSAYSGDLGLVDFDLGKWFGDPATFGKVSLNTKVEGGGVKLETLDTKLDGKIAELTLKKYTYKDLKVDGLIKGKFFSGNLEVKDHYLDADFAGTVDMTAEIPRYNFASSIRNAALKELHLVNDTLNFSGEVTADVSGKKPDDMVGSVIVNDFYILHGHEAARVKNITATSSLLAGGEKEITLRSDDLAASVKGHFAFSELGKALRAYAKYTFTKNYEDTLLTQPQQLSFNFEIFDSTALTRVIDSKFREIMHSSISGELNTDKHVLNLRGEIPEIIYDKYTFENFRLDARSGQGNLAVTASLDRVYSGDSVLVDTFMSRTVSEGDEFRFDISGADSKKYNRGAITAYLKPLKASAELRFLPSEVWLGGHKWAFAEGNRILIHGNQVTTDSLIFASGLQSIKLNAYLKNDTSTCLALNFSETSLKDFINIFNPKIKDISATATGSIRIDDVFTNPAPTGYLELRDVYLGPVPVGIIKLNGVLSAPDKKILVDGSVFGDKTNISLKGYYDLKSDEINLNNDINTINLNFLNYRLFYKYVRHVSGTATARLSLSGPVKALKLTGALRINEARVNVTYLNTTYRLKDEDIDVGDGYFDIGTINVIDSFNNVAYGTGRIYHDHFRNVSLDLHVVTDKIQALNTSAKDMPQFYGNGIAKGRVDFVGLIPLVNITAEIDEVKAGTHCYIPINNSYETNKYSFYHFLSAKKDSIPVRKREVVRQAGVNFVLKMQITPDGLLDVILDPSSGDVLRSRGRGEVKVELLRSGEFNIFGNYTIEQGNYLFTMQNIIHKNFELDKGGSITFKGDVYNAQLDASAIYKVKTSTYDLISDLLTINNASPDVEGRALNRINVDLFLQLKGVLQSPEISFDIKPVGIDPLIATYVDNKMQLMRTTEVELNKQVFGLLVMNRFLPSGNATTAEVTSGRAIGNSAANTVSEFLSSQLSLYMGSLFDNLNFKDFNVNLNFKTYDQYSSLSPGLASNSADLYARREVQLALTKKFFNQRLSVNVGGNIDIGDNTSNAGSTQMNTKGTYATGDFEVEYILDKNGVWRAKTYNRNDYDNFNNRNINKTGIGISFRKDFDNWIDLFRRKAKKPKPQNLPPPPAKPEEGPKAQKQ